MMNHAERYLKLAALTKRADSIDCSYHAAFYLISYDKELWEAACRYVNIDGIHFAGLKRAIRGFDENIRQVVDIAHSLFSWNSKCHATPFDISRLGYPYMKMVCNAIFIASDEAKVVIQHQENELPKLILDASNYQRTGRIYRQLEQLSYNYSADMVQDEVVDMER